MQPTTPQSVPDEVFLAPPAAVTAISVMGISLQDWVYILTIIWTVLGIAHHIWSKWIKPWREKRRARQQG